MKKLATLILILAVLLVPCLSLAAEDAWDLHLPEDLTEIEEAAFEGDTSLNRVYVGDQVQTIGAYAFANSSLRDIRLPESLVSVAPDAFQNVPHVEVYGFWNSEFFDGMDNVAKSGAVLPINTTTTVDVAGRQEVFRCIPIYMTGKWFFDVENCSSAMLFDNNGEKIADFSYDAGMGLNYLYYTFAETDNVYLCIRNDTDALIETKVYIESPYQIRGYVGTQQAEYKSGSTLMRLSNPARSFLLEDLAANQYYAPAFVTNFNGTTADYSIDLYVDDALIRSWRGTFKAREDEEKYFSLDPADVMKFNGFEAGEHSVRIVADSAVVEYTYTVTGARNYQSIGPDASSLYLLPDQHIFASFTAEQEGVYTFRSDTPVPLKVNGQLTDADGNILDSNVENSDDDNFSLSASLAEGQTVTLEAWFASQAGQATPFFGVVPVIVGDPFSEGHDIFTNANCMALVIGETYETAPKEISRLTGCQNDADSMTTMLTSLTGSPFTVTKRMNLTAAEILAAIPEAFAGATDNDVILFYYTGHGQQGNGALVGNDGESVTPEALKAALDQIPGTKIIMLDSCFSGYLIGRDTPEEAAEVAQAALADFTSTFRSSSRAAGNEYFVLTASSLYETSIGYQNYCSLFTTYLLWGMGFDGDDNAVRTGNAPADTNHDGMFTLDELYVYCRDGIRQAKRGQTVCPWPYNCNQVIFIDEAAQE